MRYITEKNSNDVEKIQSTRMKIMEAAAEAFSEKGYDGARVDEIAARVKVNKAMLYYYFENKEKLLEAIFNNFIEEVADLKKKFLKGKDCTDKQQIDKFYDEMFSLMNKRKDILRIITIEALKSNSQDVTIFKILHPFFESKLANLKNKGLNDDEDIGILANSFFFGMMPFLIFLTLGDRWSDFYDLDRNEVKGKFMEIFQMNQKNYYSSKIKK